MRKVNADQPTFIGFAGEVNATQVSFNLPESWETKATSSNTIALFTLPSSNVPIPYSVVVSDGYAKWTLNDEYICSKNGVGSVQIVLLVENANINDFRANGEVVCREKMPMLDTICKKSAGEITPTPTPSTPWIDKILSLIAFFIPLPAKQPNKYLGTDADSKLVFKDGGGSGSSAIIFATSRPATPTADVLYAIGTHGSYVLEAYHDGQWETFGGSLLPEYTGATTFTPSFSTQTAQTENKSVLADITINQIPVTEVDNPKGGKTVTFG